MRRFYISASLLLAMVAAGCASSPVPLPAKPNRPNLPAQALRVACPGGTTAAARRSAAMPEQAVPAGFSPAAVVLCNPAVVFLNHSGRNVPASRQVATIDLGRLMAALRAPSALPNSTAICLDQAAYLAWFVLVSKNGQVIHPKIPVTVCGDPSPAVVASLNALRWRTLR
jgi:hypothetical protein